MEQKSLSGEYAVPSAAYSSRQAVFPIYFSPHDDNSSPLATALVRVVYSSEINYPNIK
jgi:hypothetical protein